jgi:histidyl-tRNA synthetase
MGDTARIEALKIAASLRDSGVSVIVSTGDRSLKAQLRQANTVGATNTAIIGDDEVKAGTVMLRNMENGEQQEIQPEELKRLLGSQQ